MEYEAPAESPKPLPKFPYPAPDNHPMKTIALLLSTVVALSATASSNHANIPAVTPRSNAEYTWAAGNGIVG